MNFQRPIPSRFSSLSALQLFQMLRYGAFVLIGVCFAKLSLGQDDIGRFETFLLVSSMLSFFWVSGMINSMLSVYPKKNEEDKKAVLFNTFLSLSFLSVAAGVLLFTFSENLLLFLDKDRSGGLIQLSVFFLLLNNPSFISEYILFLNNKKKELVIYGMAFAILSFSAAVIPIYINYHVEYAMYGFIGVAALRILFALFLVYKFGAFRFDWRLQLDQLKISLPIIGSIFVSGSAEYIDGILVKAKFNDTDFAIYRYGAKELPILLIIANTFSSAMITAVSANLDEGLKQIKKNSAHLMHLFFPLTIILMVTSPYIYPLVFNQSFASSAIIFNIYLLLIIPRVLFPQTILTGIHASRFLFISSLIEITLNVSCSILLSMKFGLVGIAYGTVISSLFDKFFLVAVCHFVFRISIRRFLLYIPYLVYVSLTIVAFIISYKMMPAV
ncbi:MAG: oligosaccharide flippase family protein [Bacteroidetes bacterium]|nr:oligosaccharide flippase family protein [Bacteroidota bacterium]